MRSQSQKLNRKPTYYPYLQLWASPHQANKVSYGTLINEKSSFKLVNRTLSDSN